MKRQPINTDNYEEYFLLYVDNELTAAEKAEVESFVALNPSLQIELQMFQDTKLTPEDFKMEGLEDLYRKEEELINQNNYEEFQVLLLDDELDEETRHAIENFNQSNTEAAENFEWLKKTKLSPETIVFRNKEVLYRQEKTTRIIEISWVRYAAAAVVIFLAGLYWLTNINEDTNIGVEQPLANVKEKLPVKSSPGSPSEIAEEKTVPEENVVSNSPVDNQQSAIEINKIASAKTTRTSEPGPSQKMPNNELAKNETKPEKNTDEMVAVVKNETRINTEDLITSKPSEAAAPSVTYTQTAVALNVKTNYATEALNNEMKDDDVEPMPLQEEPKQRKGLRGIVRKANRIYNKVTNPDLDKPLVKVANIEIGIQR